MYPVASEADLPARHVFFGRLWGQELAIWRADDGHVNVWENRCVHRGVRLTTGMNDGSELVCQYHGWRYLNRSAACSYIPAHPAETPASALCIKRYACAHAYGLIWTGHPADSPPVVAELDDGFTVLRAVPINSPATQVQEQLIQHSREVWGATVASPVSSLALKSQASQVVVTHQDSHARAVVYFIQPTGIDRCIVRPVMATVGAQPAGISVLRRHSRLLERFRKTVEAESGEVAPRVHQTASARGDVLTPLPVARASAGTPGRSPVQTLLVRRKRQTAEDIAAFELTPTKGQLIPFLPGAHIDIHLDVGLVRQYSIINGPQHSDCYRIGVKRELDSRGGSRYLHDRVREGDHLRVSAPRYNFPLRRDAHTTLLIAGGIGSHRCFQWRKHSPYSN